MYEPYYDILQTHYRKKNKQCHHIDMDAFVLGKFSSNIIKDVQNFKDLIDYSNFENNHEVNRNKTEKVVGKFKTETPKKFLKMNFYV